MRTRFRAGLRRVFRAVRFRILGIEPTPPAAEIRARLPPDVDESVVKIGSIAEWGLVHGNLELMRQIMAETRSLGKRKPKGWNRHLAYFPNTARGAKATQARLLLERQLKVPVAETSDEDLSALVTEVERSEPELSVAWWIVTYLQLFRRTHVAAAWSAQEMAARRVLAETETYLTREGGAQALLAAATFLFGEKMDEAILTRVGSKPGRLSTQMRFDALLTMGRISEAHALAKSRFSRGDHALAARLSGKRVALVGPARNDLGNGAEIDASDFVVRTGFLDTEGFRSNASMLGTRVDLSYYNSVLMRQRQAEIMATLREHPKVIAAFRSSWALEAAQANARRTALHRYQISSQVFFGRGYALQHCVRDLLRFSPAKIKIYGADFFLSPEIYYASYMEGNSNQINSYISHNVFDTWQFLKTLKKIEAIEADEVLSGILDLPASAFAAAIGNRLKLYGGKKSVSTEASPP